MFQTKVMNNPINNETQDIIQDSSSIYFSQQTSKIIVQKRTRRAAASHTTTQKIQTAYAVLNRLFGCHIISFLFIYL